MSIMNAPVRRSGGDLDVYTGLLFAAFVVLTTGVVTVAMANMKQVEPLQERGASIQSESVLLGVPGFEVIK
ncbi:MAG: hypothetical protein CMJ67_03840 [Planctomycetaceae bacterium]|nr:hypothetical protein [Planctomycetaceae bacterium]